MIPVNLAFKFLPYAGPVQLDRIKDSNKLLDKLLLFDESALAVFLPALAAAIVDVPTQTSVLELLELLICRDPLLRRARRI